MSYPRHSMIYRDCRNQNWWLQMTPDYIEPEDATSADVETYGPFDSADDAEGFTGNFSNIGYATPRLDFNVFDCMPVPHSYTTPEKHESEASADVHIPDWVFRSEATAR